MIGKLLPAVKARARRPQLRALLFLYLNDFSGDDFPEFLHIFVAVDLEYDAAAFVQYRHHIFDFLRQFLTAGKFAVYFQIVVIVKAVAAEFHPERCHSFSGLFSGIKPVVIDPFVVRDILPFHSGTVVVDIDLGVEITVDTVLVRQPVVEPGNGGGSAE